MLLGCLASASAETLLLTGATVHTVVGPPLANGAVLIKDGKIESVGPASKAKADKVLRLEGQHLFPGLIAASSQLGLVEIGAVRATRDAAEVGDYVPEVQSWVAANPDSELIPVARANGITHALLVPEGGVVAGQSGLIALDGWTTEQMAVKCPAALHVYWPSQDLDLGPRESGRGSRAKSPEEQAKDRRARLKALDDFFDDARAYAKARDAAGKDGAAALEANPAWEAVRPYLRGELPLMLHADELRQIKSALRWAETNGFKVILAGGRDAWMAAGQLATNHVPVIYEHVFTLPARDTDSYDVHFRAPALLSKAGVTVAFGGRRQAASLRNLPYEAAQAAAFGLPAEEALKGLTLYAARILGVADRLGSIESGKEATLFAADGHILDIRANVKRMWIAGREVSLETRHTRLYERYKQRPPPK